VTKVENKESGSSLRRISRIDLEDPANISIGTLGRMKGGFITIEYDPTFEYSRKSPTFTLALIPLVNKSLSMQVYPAMSTS